jgi:hypothetical protein
MPEPADERVRARSSMFSSIHIAGYRGFRRFEMANLGRVNLLVGNNSSGKTSMLEALYLLASRGDPTTLGMVLWRRGERLPADASPRRPAAELDVSHLFHGHEAHVQSRFTLSARDRHPSEQSVTISIVEVSPREQPELFPRDEGEPLTPRLALQIRGHPTPPVEILALTRSGGIFSDVLDVGPRRVRRRTSEGTPAQFISTESLDSEELVSLWDKVALTPNEDLVLGALRFVEPDIQRIAAQAGRSTYGTPSRGGFIVRSHRYEMPVPIGSLGDGIWRMLAMAIAITQSAGGILLVDEIDTGLHYTVLADMWKLIFGAARQLDVQVFATTHSFDCIQSLATVCVTDADASNHVTLQRIEPGKTKAVPYTEPEIQQAAARNIEVR